MSAPKTIADFIAEIARETEAPDSFVDQVGALFMQKGIPLASDGAPYAEAIRQTFLSDAQLRASTAQARQHLAELKDRLQRLFTGRGLYWGFPDDVSQKWRDQMGGERLKQKTLPNGKIVHEWVEVGRAGTHLRDCECMVLVCAIADRLMDGEGLMREAEKPEPKVEAEASG